jgi:hypothetical protein
MMAHENKGLMYTLRSYAAPFIASMILVGCGGSVGTAVLPDSSASPTTPVATTAPESVNVAPTVAGTPITAAKAGQLYQYIPDVQDENGDALTFSVINLPTWATFDALTGTIKGTPEDSDVGDSDEITITVTDTMATSSIGPFEISVSARNTVAPAANSAPKISGVPNSSVPVAVAYSFTPSASDADGDKLSFAIVNKPVWAKFSTSTGVLAGTPSAAQSGAYAKIVISVSDGKAAASLPAFSIQVNQGNRSPVIGGVAAASTQPGKLYSFQPTASDPDGDPLSFAISGKPSWASFNATTGRLTGTPTSANLGTSSNIVISVSDGKTSTSLSAFSIQVNTTPNNAPVIGGSAASSVQAGQAYSFTPTASDADHDALGFSIVNKPAWASFSASNGQLSGTPASAQAGSYSNIVITVSDGKTTASLASFSITVAGIVAANHQPTISGTPATAVTVGGNYLFQPNASDVDQSDTLSFSIQNKPSWATFSTVTGRLSGTPAAGNIGNYSNIVITTNDGETAPISLPAFSINVTQPASAPSTATGSATLSWTAPIEMTDGSALTNLAGYRVYYGASASALTNTVELANPGLTTYVIANLSAGTYYFAVKAYTTANVESDLSNVGSKTIE